MAKNRKAAKTTKKGRTKVKKLPVGEKELTAAQAKKVKGGNLAGVTAATATITTLTLPAFTAAVGGDLAKKILASELLIKK